MSLEFRFVNFVALPGLTGRELIESGSNKKQQREVQNASPTSNQNSEQYRKKWNYFKSKSDQPNAWHHERELGALFAAGDSSNFKNSRPTKDTWEQKW